MTAEKPLLIGICGLKGSGKSEVAKRLEVALSAQRVRFSGPLKGMLRSLGLTEDEIEGSLKEQPCDKLCGQTPRHAMVTLGTEWGRELIGHDIWINAWQRNATAHLVKGSNVITEDLRFPNEYEALVGAGGIVLRVARPGIRAGEHESERHAASFAAHIEFWNDGSLDDLAQWVDAVLPGEVDFVRSFAANRSHS
jgi:predicted kinase